MDIDAAAPDLDRRLAARLATMRADQGWTLEALAERSGISRATLSRLERGETSPTATLLGRLAAAYGRTTSRLLAEVEAEPPLLMRREAQTLWVDPETGFRRRAVSPPASGFDAELVEGELPPGAVISYERSPAMGLEHHLWMLGGQLDLTVETVTHRLGSGDCLRYRLFGTSRFACPGPDPAHYIIAICRP
jgi:transcriptional regulator with XRE-family HTH domain